MRADGAKHTARIDTVHVVEEAIGAADDAVKGDTVAVASAIGAGGRTSGAASARAGAVDGAAGDHGVDAAAQ